MTPDELHAEFTRAMKARDMTRLAVVRAVRGRVADAEREQKKPATEADIERAVRQTLRITAEEAKVREERLGPNEQRVLMLKSQIEWLESVLPAPLDEATYRTLVANAIEATGATSMRDMRNIITHVQESAPSTPDNATVSRIAKEMLA